MVIKLIIPFADGAAHEPIQRPVIFSVTSFCGPYAGYRKYGISYRELQEMLAERGANVDHSTIYRWVQRYAPEMENGCAGTGVTLPIFARGTWMKPT